MTIDHKTLNLKSGTETVTSLGLFLDQYLDNYVAKEMISPCPLCVHLFTHGRTISNIRIYIILGCHDSNHLWVLGT